MITSQRYITTKTNHDNMSKILRLIMITPVKTDTKTNHDNKSKIYYHKTNHDNKSKIYYH